MDKGDSRQREQNVHRRENVNERESTRNGECVSGSKVPGRADGR